VPRKALGQHFLHDPKLLDAIVQAAGVTGEDRVLEVGTGPGTFTRALALRAREVLSVEIDVRLAAFALSELADLPNVRVLVADALSGSELGQDLAPALAALGPFLWVANLPYKIAATLILAVCESNFPWRSAALTVQEEVAERITASPGSAAYGPLTVLLAHWAAAEKGLKIPPGAFWPAPAVDSRLLHLVPTPALGPREDYGRFRGWVKLLFAQRRKQVQKTLRRALGEAAAEEALAAGGWDPKMRPEDLSPADYLRLARLFPPPGRAVKDR
jgi:16S rRNA (adenine1518-N6/adenine1519-N6)-dimethyltransferase